MTVQTYLLSTMAMLILCWLLMLLVSLIEHHYDKIRNDKYHK